MIKPITRSALPEGSVKSVLIGAEYIHYISALEKRGIECLKVPANPDIDPRIAYHSDMSVMHFGSNDVFITCSNAYLCTFMQSLQYIVHICDNCGNNYPFDIKTNACLVGNVLFYHKKGTSADIIKFAEQSCIKTVAVNQGYVKCSVCVLDDSHIITDDAGIAEAAGKNGIEAFYLENSGILLKGFDKGFVGGASGKTAKNEIVFTGRFNSDRAELFAEKNGIRFRYLTDEPAQDIGSIIPLTETI